MDLSTEIYGVGIVAYQLDLYNVSLESILSQQLLTKRDGICRMLLASFSHHFTIDRNEARCELEVAANNVNLKYLSRV